MGKSFDPIGLAGEMREAELLNSTPRPIVSMSFQLAIPWRVRHGSHIEGVERKSN